MKIKELLDSGSYAPASCAIVGQNLAVTIFTR
jgi:hypothetical protein